MPMPPFKRGGISRSGERHPVNPAIRVLSLVIFIIFGLLMLGIFVSTVRHQPGFALFSPGAVRTAQMNIADHLWLNGAITYHLPVPTTDFQILRPLGGRSSYCHISASTWLSILQASRIITHELARTATMHKGK